MAAEEALSGEREAIVRVVTDAYVDGVHNFRDPAAMRRGFHPDFEMFLLRDGKLVKVPLAKWIEANGSAQSQGATAQADSRCAARDDGELRCRRCHGHHRYLQGRNLAGRQAASFTDYLALYKFDDGWKIVAKSFFSHS